MNQNEIEELKKHFHELHDENRLLKISFCKCRDCKHADLYIPYYIYPHHDPKCSLTGNNITPEQGACEEFSLIGRCSR